MLTVLERESLAAEAVKGIVLEVRKGFVNELERSGVPWRKE